MSVQVTLYPDGRLKTCQLTACWAPDWDSHQGILPGYHQTVMTLAYRPCRQDLIFSTEIIPYDQAPTFYKKPPMYALTEDRLAVRAVVNVLRYLKKGGRCPFVLRAERRRFVQSLLHPGRRP